MCGLIQHKLLDVAFSTLPWAVRLRSSYDTISTMDGFLESDFVVLTKKLNQELSDYYVGPDVELVVSPVNNAVTPATQLTCLHCPTPDALIRLADSGGHSQRFISLIRARAYLNLLALRRPSPPDYMRVISCTGCGALAIFFASHESSFKVPSDCYTMVAHRALGLTAERASHVRVRVQVPSVQ
jgi:hypothetical protein